MKPLRIEDGTKQLNVIDDNGRYHYGGHYNGYSLRRTGSRDFQNSLERMRTDSRVHCDARTQNGADPKFNARMQNDSSFDGESKFDTRGAHSDGSFDSKFDARVHGDSKSDSSYESRVGHGDSKFGARSQSVDSRVQTDPKFGPRVQNNDSGSDLKTPNHSRAQNNDSSFNLRASSADPRVPSNDESSFELRSQNDGGGGGGFDPRSQSEVGHHNDRQPPPLPSRHANYPTLPMNGHISHQYHHHHHFARDKERSSRERSRDRVDKHRERQMEMEMRDGVDIGQIGTYRA